MTDPFQLPQVLILPQELSFARLRQAMDAIGFADAETGVSAAPLIDGEPEAAAWDWPGGIPRVNYSFNPVVRLRVLDVGAVPPRLRAVLAEQLGPLHPAGLREALASGDDRQRLWGVWAALEAERLDLIHEIGRVAESARGSLRDEAERALRRLAELAERRLETRAGARLIATAALDLIAELRDGAEIRRYLPGAEDCAALFAPQIAQLLAQVVAARRWPTRGIAAQPAGPDEVFVAPAGLFRWKNEIANQFPNGYRNIAGWMNPSRIWLGWTGTDPQGTALRFDGLAFYEGRWVFFPKPFRLVEPLLPAMPEPAQSWPG